MAAVIIQTDGTIENTKLKVDGNDITKDEKVTSIFFHCSSPYVSKYGEGVIPGNVGISYEVVKDDGTFERKIIGMNDTNYKEGVGKKVSNSDSVVRHIGHNVDIKVSDIVTQILKVDDSISYDKLINRTYESLKDKAEDLGITISSQ